MGVQAIKWAFRQKLPPQHKLLLLALADQADEKTGRVRYGRTDAKHLAEKASISIRTVARYIAKLTENGYVEQQSGRDRRGCQRANTYWLKLDRGLEHRTDNDEAALNDDLASAEEQERGGRAACLTDSARAADESERLPAADASPSANTWHTKLHPEPHYYDGDAVLGFSKQAKEIDREQHALAARAAAVGAGTFVVEGSRPWKAWCKYREKSGEGPPPRARGTGKYHNRLGWYFPSLYPPSKLRGTSGASKTENYNRGPPAKPLPKAAPLSIEIEGSPSWRARIVIAAIAGGPAPVAAWIEESCGARFASPLSAEQIGLQEFADTDPEFWPVVRAGTPQCDAWQRFVGAEPRQITTGYRRQALNGKIYENWRIKVSGLPVPCVWPPTIDKIFEVK